MLMAAIVAASTTMPFSAQAFVIPSTATKPSVVPSSISVSALSLFPPEALHVDSSNPALREALSSASLLLGDDLSSSSATTAAVDAARQKFWFYFFAGSGAGGIGLSQVPAVFRDAAAARSVAGAGPTRGGAPLNAGPLLGIYYDEEISSMDVGEAIEKAPSAEFISSRSRSQNYLAGRGYIDRWDFVREMEGKGCNPLASYALFDAISSGKGDVVSPVVYDEKLAVYRKGGDGGGVAASFVGDLNGFLAVKVGAFAALVFCLLIDLGLIVKAGIEGFLS